jgi:hypothetical protein
MEFSSFSSPESSPGSGGPNPSPESGKDSNDSKKKKSTGSTALRAEIVTESSDRKQADDSAERASKTESLWKKLTGDAASQPQPDMALFGIQKPEETSSAEAKKQSENPEVAGPGSSEAAAVESDAEAEPEPEKLTDAELKHAAQEIIKMDLEAAEGELYERSRSESEPDGSEAAVAAAPVAMLREMGRNLGPDSTMSVSEALDAAHRVVSEDIESFTRDDTAEAEAGSAESESEDAEDSAEAGDSDVPPTDPEADDDEPDAPDPTDPSTASTVPPARPPVVPPTGPPHGPPGGPPFSPYGPYGPMPPIVPVYGATPPPGGPHGTAGFGSPDVMPVETAWHNERVAGARGLIVGVLAGLYFGNRHGKKVGRRESDKKSAPVIRSFEQQIKGLQDNITAKEQQLKAQARDKLDSLMKGQERQRLADRLLQTAATQTASRETHRPDVLTVGGDSMPAGRRTEVAGAGITRESDRRRRETAVDRSDAARVGRLLVEAPLLAAAVLPLAAERTRPVSTEELSRPASSAERAGVVPFNKKVEEFSHEELMTTAEKLTVQGVSLKEMVAVGSLNEQSLRRVIGEFLDGGDVSKAVSREVKEKELKYERDPRMRHAAAAATQAAGSGGSGGLAAVGQADDGVDTMELPTAQGSPAYTGPRPTPDAAMLKAIRNKQMATVATTTVLVALAVIILIIITG